VPPSSEIEIFGEDDLGTAEDYGVAEKYVPEGWETQEKFLEHATKLYDSDVKYDKENRDWAMEDLQFLAGDQWDADTKKDRLDALRPCLTINVLPQFVGQVVGDRRINKTTIKVRPLKDGTSDVAEVRSGLIKSIELYSRAERVYDAACEDQVACGISNFRVDLEYAGNDVFDQDILIRHIPNPLSVVWDRMSVDPTGRDARHCFVADYIPKDIYDKQFPDYPCPTGFSDDRAKRGDWWDGEAVRLTEFWELVDKPATFAMMADGDVKDVTDIDPEEYMAELWRNPQTGETKIRQSFRTYARMHLVTSFAILTKAYEIPVARLPIIRVEGRVVRVGDDRVRFGLVRFAKDSQRLKNYWRSVAAEVLALAPKATWIAPSDAIEGREDEWDRSHINAGGVLVFNKNASEKPERVNPPLVPAALLQEAQLNQQDIKDTTGLHDASLGMRSNEVSGVAIDARKAEGDVATVIYHDNLNHAIQECGDVINQLIPIAYDATRTVRVIGDDDKHKLMRINDPADENSPDITRGKYDVTLETGPSFSTQRHEALDGMMKLIQTSPELMGVIGDLVAKNMDWPGAYEIAERMRKMPSIQQFVQDEDEEGGQPTEEQMMQMQQMEQMRQMEQTQQEAAVEGMRLELEQQRSKAQQAESNARAAEANVRQAEANADAAEAKAVQAQHEANAAPAIISQKIRLAERSANAKATPNNRGAGSRPGGDRSNKNAPRKE